MLQTSKSVAGRRNQVCLEGRSMLPVAWHPTTLLISRLPMSGSPERPHTYTLLSGFLSSFSLSGRPSGTLVGGIENVRRTRFRTLAMLAIGASSCGRLPTCRAHFSFCGEKIGRRNAIQRHENGLTGTGQRTKAVRAIARPLMTRREHDTTHAPEFRT
jgi:hypothetical protein